MSEPYIGEIRLFGLGFVPRGWAACDGQILAISTNQVLYSILGTTYGGDGRTTFALPDLRGRVPIGVSAPYTQGQAGGEETHALTVAEMPSHSHTVTASSGRADKPVINNNFWAGTTSYSDSPDTTMSSNAIATAGARAPHNNMQPYLSLTYCIAIQGEYPSRE